MEYFQSAEAAKSLKHVNLLQSENQVVDEVAVNCDGSVSVGGTIAGCGEVVRDHLGGFLCGFEFPPSCIVNALRADLAQTHFPINF